MAFFDPMGTHLPAKLGWPIPNVVKSATNAIVSTCDSLVKSLLPFYGRNEVSELERYTFLHKLLWANNTTLRSQIIYDETYDVPDLDPDHSTKMAKFTMLSLEKVRTSQAYPKPEKYSALLPCGFDTLLVREAYKESLARLYETDANRRSGEKRISKRMKNILQKSGKGTIFTRHPRIGKTCFLSYVLVNRLLCGEPTVLQIGNAKINNHLLFDHKGVRFVYMNDPVMSDGRIWSLTDQSPLGVADLLDVHSWLTIITSSPRKSNYFSQKKQYNMQLYYMPPWNGKRLRELLDDPEKLAILYDLFNDFGPIPRILLEQLHPSLPRLTERVFDYRSEIKRKLPEFIPRGLTAMSDQFSGHDSHQLVLLQPFYHAETSTKHISGAFKIVLISPYVGHLLGFQIEQTNKRTAYSLYNMLYGNSLTKSSAGWMFEGLVHGFLQRGGQFTFSNLKTYDEVTRNITGLTHGELVSPTFNSLAQLSSLTRESVGSRKVSSTIIGRYLRPERFNLCSIDGLCILDSPDGFQVLLFQITTAQSHPVKLSGLQQVWNSLPHEVQGSQPVLVFVVPTDKADKYKPQPITPVDELSCSQWALPIDHNQLWNIESTEEVTNLDISDTDSEIPLSAGKRNGGKLLPPPKRRKHK